MPYNSNTLFQKMPDKVSFFYAQISKKWLELSLKKFSSYIFKNNGESETVLYLTNGRKRRVQETKIVLSSYSLLYDHFTSEINPVSTSYTAPEITTSSGIKGETLRSLISSRTLSSIF